MISKFKLNEGFIVNDKGELKHLFLKAAKYHGFCTKWFDGKEDALFGAYLFIDEEGVVNGNANLSRVHGLGRKVLTLEDFYIEEEPQKPDESEVKYIPVKCSVWEIASFKDDFEAGLLYKAVDRIHDEVIFKGVADYADMIKSLINGTLHCKTVTNWYDKLDGTEENGVWCWVWDDDSSVMNVELITDYYPTHPDGYLFGNVSEAPRHNAKPMSQQAREEMLKIMKENV